jgi:hypothetical protein
VFSPAYGAIAYPHFVINDMKRQEIRTLLTEYSTKVPSIYCEFTEFYDIATDCFKVFQEVEGLNNQTTAIMKKFTGPGSRPAIFSISSLIVIPTPLITKVLPCIGYP